jgi:hypothetical protein
MHISSMEESGKCMAAIMYQETGAVMESCILGLRCI